MATQTNNMALTKPADSDAAQISVINTNMDTLDAHRHAGGTDGLKVKAVQADLLEYRPAAGNQGQLYVATDGPTLYMDNGTTWTAVSPDAEVVAKSNTTPDGSTTAFNIGTGVASKRVEVRKNGLVKVETDDYTFTQGNSYVTFVSAPLVGDVVSMKYVAQ